MVALLLASCTDPPHRDPVATIGSSSEEGAPTPASAGTDAEAPGNQWGETGTTAPAPICEGRLRILSGAGLMAGDGFGAAMVDLFGQSGDGLGTFLADVGDIDGDGRDDLVLSVADRFRLVSGSALASGRVDLAGAPAIGDAVPLGQAWPAATGDVTGDGIGDLAISETYGPVAIYDGSGLADGDPPIGRIASGGVGSPYEVVVAGDTDGDGLGDLIVWRYSVQAPNMDGLLFRAPFDRDRSLDAPDLTLLDLRPVGLGDLDRDGHDDLGAMRPYDLPLTESLTVAVFGGASLTGAEIGIGDADWTISDLWEKATVVGVGDVDGDGAADLGLDRETGLDLYSGTALDGRQIDRPDLRLGPTYGHGRVVTADLDGDGAPEVAIHAAPQILLFDDLRLDGGSDPLPTQTLLPDTGYGDRVVAVGDVDGDGAVDLAFSEPYVGCPEGTSTGATR